MHQILVVFLISLGSYLLCSTAIECIILIASLTNTPDVIKLLKSGNIERIKSIVDHEYFVLYTDFPICIGFVRIFRWILDFYYFAERGFDNTENVRFVVNEQIKFSGDTKFYITKEKYLGNSKKRPLSISYYLNNHNLNSGDLISYLKGVDTEGITYPSSSVDNHLFDSKSLDVKFYDNFCDAVSDCSRLQAEYENRIRRQKQIEYIDEEEEKMNRVKKTNRYFM